MAELTQAGARELAERFLRKVAADPNDEDGGGDQLADVLPSGEFDADEWEKAVDAVAAELKAATISVSWPGPDAEPFADRPGYGWRRCTPQLLGETGADCGEMQRRPAVDGQGHEHLVFVGTSEPFADRDRWYPALAFGSGEVEPDGHAVLFAGHLDNAPDLDGCPWYEAWIFVARRSGLPSERTDGWRIDGHVEAGDLAFDRSAPSGWPIEDVHDARSAWLDAVAVAESRNQRAEER